MAEIEVDKFRPRTWIDPRARIATWAARMSAAPDSRWWTVFHAELVTEALIGNTVPAPRIEGGFLVFDAPELLASAGATVIHRAVERTNRKVTDLEGRDRQQLDALKQDYEQAGADLARLQERYKNGI